MKNYFLLIVFLFLSYESLAQKHLEILEARPSISDSELRVEMLKWMNEKEIGIQEKKQMKKYERWAMLNEGAISASGQRINQARKIWDEQKILTKKLQQNSNQNSRSANGNWQNYNPSTFTAAGDNKQGRLNCIAIHPTNPNIIYVGSVMGGLWWSNNGGTSWAPLTLGLPILGISSIVINPQNTNEMYIMTGSADGKEIPTIGILKSTNAGTTWEETAFSAGIDDEIYGYKLIMHPSSPNIMYAVTSDGIYQTDDGWMSMPYIGETIFGIRRFGHHIGKIFYDIEFRPDNPSWLYASTDKEIYRTIDGGVNWIKLNDISTGLPSGMQTTRIALAVSPLVPGRLMALYARDINGNGYQGLYISNDRGITWTVKTDPLNILGAGNYNQSFFNLVMEIDPDDANTIYVGGISVYKSTVLGNAGSWVYIGQSVHADNHAYLFNNGNFYVCSDGGIKKSSNKGASWTNISVGLNIRMYYFIDVDDTRIIAGAQDNFTTIWNKGSSFGTILTGGDGLKPIFHPSDPNTIFTSSQDKRFRYSNGITGNEESILPSQYEGGIWGGQWTIHPDNHDTMYTATGGRHFLRSYNRGDINSWEVIDSGFNLRTRAIAQSPSNPNVMYTSDTEKIRRTINLHSLNVIWSDRTSNLPASGDNIMDLVVDPNNVSRVWALLGGFNNGKKIYYSDDAGLSWHDYSEGLPNVRCYSMEYQVGSLDGIYIGTDLGVFYRNSRMSSWEYFSNGLPNIQVRDLKIQGGHLYAATFGMGVWRSDLASTCPDTWLVNSSTVPYGINDVGSWIYNANLTVISSLPINANLGTDLLFKAGSFVRLDPGFEIKAGSTFTAQIGNCDY